MGAASREALIAAAIDHIAEFGVMASTTTRIAARARVSRGSLQHHFPSRDDLLYAVAERVTLPDLVDDLDALAARPLRDRVEHFYSYYERGALDNRYAAAVNLATSLDPQSELSVNLGRLMESAVRSNESVHARIFADIDIARDEMLAVVRTTFAMLQGAHRPRGRPELHMDQQRLREIQFEMLMGFFNARQRVKSG